MPTYLGFSSEYGYKNFKVTDFELALQDLINHLNIKPGEKLMNPKFGCIVWDMLFENFTDDVKSAIVENIADIIDQEPRLNLDSINVVEYDQGIQVELALSYIPSALATNLVLTFDQQADGIYVTG
jgi:phage baseplate assembly protein W